MLDKGCRNKTKLITSVLVVLTLLQACNKEEDAQEHKHHRQGRGPKRGSGYHGRHNEGKRDVRLLLLPRSQQVCILNPCAPAD